MVGWHHLKDAGVLKLPNNMDKVETVIWTYFMNIFRSLLILSHNILLNIASMLMNFASTKVWNTVILLIFRTYQGEEGVGDTFRYHMRKIIMFIRRSQRTTDLQEKTGEKLWYKYHDKKKEWMTQILFMEWMFLFNSLIELQVLGCVYFRTTIESKGQKNHFLFSLRWRISSYHINCIRIHIDCSPIEMLRCLKRNGVHHLFSIISWQMYRLRAVKSNHIPLKTSMYDGNYPNLIKVVTPLTSSLYFSLLFNPNGKIDIGKPSDSIPNIAAHFQKLFTTSIDNVRVWTTETASI